MVRRKKLTSAEEFSEALKTADTALPTYVLRLYVAGMTPRSTRAIADVKRVCDEDLAGRCELEIVDMYQQPTLAKGEQIIASPTLIKKLPLPLRRIIGDMSDKEKFLVGLDLRLRNDRDDDGNNG